MAAAFTKKAQELLDRPVLAVFATIAGDGTPQQTPVWFERDGGDLLFNTSEGRAKPTNIRRDPRISVCVVDPGDPYNVVVAAGRVEELTTEGADEHIDHLAQVYLGVDRYPLRQPGEVRLKGRFRPQRVVMQPGD